jgi:potassium-transporting ATPase ATP-binding subunit
MKDRVNPRRSVRSLFDPAITVAAIGGAFRKLDPRIQIRNPVMFVVEIVTVLTTILYLRDLLTGGENLKFTFQIIVWLWITLLFANFAEAVAEGRGKAQAATLRKARTDTRAKRLIDPNGRSGMKEVFEGVSAVDLQIGDVVLVEAGDLIPSDGDVIEGVPSIDESAITGESAPVIRESGGDRSAVTGGTRVLSDWIRVCITAAQGSTFLDRMIAPCRRSGAAENAERDRAQHSSCRFVAHLCLRGRDHPELCELCRRQG